MGDEGVAAGLWLDGEFARTDLDATFDVFESVGLKVDIRTSSSRSNVLMGALLIMPLKGALGALGAEAMKLVISKVREVLASRRTNGKPETTEPEIELKFNEADARFVISHDTPDIAIDSLVLDVSPVDRITGTYVYDPQIRAWRQQ